VAVGRAPTDAPAPTLLQFHRFFFGFFCSFFIDVPLDI